MWLLGKIMVRIIIIGISNNVGVIIDGWFIIRVVFILIVI